MQIVKLPESVETTLLPEDLVQELKQNGLVNFRYECCFTIGDSILQSYYSLKGEERYCGLDTRQLIVLGFGTYLYFSSVYSQKKPPEFYVEWEEYLCIDLSRGGYLVKLRPYYQDLWFLNKSVGQFNECMWLNESFGAEASAVLEEDEQSLLDTIPPRFHFALSQIDPDIVGDWPLYSCETEKFWSEAVRTFFEV